jgi:small subunit ribosomal protein S17
MTASGVYGGRKILEGIVVSDKMESTVLVSVEERMRHRLYKKTVKRQRKFMAHDEELHPQMGDRVRIVEARPMSRRKRWLVIEVLQRVELPEVAPESIDLELLGEIKPPVVEEPEASEATAAVVADGAPETETVEEAVEPEATVAEEPEAAADEPEEAVAEAEVAVEEAEAEPIIEETTDETTEAEATTKDEEEKAE